MSIDPAIKKRIIKNSLLSVFIYALPVLALFVYLKYTGEEPWNKDNKPYTKQIERYQTEKKQNN